MMENNENPRVADEYGKRRIPIVRLQIVVDETVEYLREKRLATSRQAAEWMERNIIRHADREQIVVVCCDASGRATNIDIVSKGASGFCLAPIPEIFKVAIITNAVSIILFHNHPSGDPTPSQMDVELTESVRKAGEMLDIELADHIIIGSNGRYYSFMEDAEAGGSSDAGRESSKSTVFQGVNATGTGWQFWRTSGLPLPIMLHDGGMVHYHVRFAAVK